MLAAGHFVSDLRGDGFRRHPVVLLEYLPRRAFAEGVDAEGETVGADESAPRLGSPELDGDPSYAFGQDGLTVGYVLFEEGAEGGHRDDAGAQADQGCGGLRQVSFGTGSDQDELRVGQVADDVPSAQDDSWVEVGGSFEGRDGLPREHQGSTFGGSEVEREHPSDGGLEAVGGAPHVVPWNQSERAEVFDGLVSRPVFSEAYGVVGEDGGGADLHQRLEPQGRAHIVAEGEEGGAEGYEQSGQAEAAGDRTHRVLADAERDVASGEVTFFHEAPVFDVGLAGDGEVGGPTDQGGHLFGQGVDGLVRQGTGGGVLGAHGREHALESSVGEGRVEVRIERGREGGVVSSPVMQVLAPLGVGRLAAGGGLLEEGADRVGDFEGREGPAELGLSLFSFFLPERLPVDFRSVLPAASEADVSFGENQGRAVVFGATFVEGSSDLGRVVSVDLQSMPTVRVESLFGVFAEGDFGFSVDGDLVVVVDGDELAEPEVSGEGCGLAADALHETPIAAEDEDVVIEGLEALAAEAGSRHASGEGHTDRVGEALAEGAGGGLHAGGESVLRVAGGLGAELAEALQLVHGQVIAGEVEQSIQQHRRVSIRENEPIAIGPGWVGRVEPHELGEEYGGDVGHAKRGAGVPAISLVHRIDREGSEGVGGQFVERSFGHALVSSQRLGPNSTRVVQLASRRHDRAMPLELGPAELSEAAEIAHMSRDFVEHGLAWRYRPDAVLRLIRARDVEVVAAREDGQVLGFGIMRYEDESAHLLLFAVREDRRRAGIGRSLMEWLLRMAETAGIQRIHVEVRSSNGAARAFYRAFGFREVALVRGYYQGRESAVRALLTLWNDPS